MIDAKGKRMPAKELSDAKRIVLYFTASTNPAGNELTPKLVDFYRKKGGGKAFQLLFISREKDDREMETYMRDAEMPWWGVRSSYTARKITNAYQGDPMPCLILLDESGNVLADSHQGGTEAVLAAISDGR